MGDFGIDTHVEGSSGRYAATLNSDWRIWGPMGGYVASTALRAAAAEAPPGTVPASFSCQFFTPAAFEVIDIAVDVRRASKRTAAIAVSITQHDVPILDAQMWFTTDRDLVVHDHAPLHRHGHPDDHPGVEAYNPEPPPFPFWTNFEGKPLDWIDDWENFKGDKPEWAEWLKFVPSSSFDDPVVEACRLLLLADLPSYPAATRAHPAERERSWIAPSLDLAVQFHRLDDIGDWLLTAGTAPIADRGLIGFRSEVWTADRRLAASGAGQLLCRPVPPAN